MATAVTLQLLADFDSPLALLSSLKRAIALERARKTRAMISSFPTVFDLLIVGFTSFLSLDVW